MSGIGLAVLAAALVLTGAAAWWLRTRDGAIRSPGTKSPGKSPATMSPVTSRSAMPAAMSPGASPAGREDGTGAREVLEGLGARPAEADLTVVQFSTAFCAPCRATRTRLQQLQAAHPGLAYLHVDAESHLDEVRALDVRRTPTLFYLDRAGALIGRSSGAPRPEELTALVEAHTGQLW